MTGNRRLFDVVFIDDELTLGDHMACLCPFCGVFQLKDDIQIPFAVGILPKFQINVGRFTRLCTDQAVAAVDNLAAADLLPVKIVFGKVGEHEVVPDPDFALYGVRGFKVNVLVKPLHFGHLGAYAAVGEKQAVTAEVSVVRVVAEVSAVADVFCSVPGFRPDSLVNKIPDKKSEEVLVFE